jgi:hypothetical protein
LDQEFGESARVIGMADRILSFKQQRLLNLHGANKSVREVIHTGVDAQNLPVNS